ncbi:ABC transporter substrate-binding protein [Roseiterribacter gracilis]|uniref:Putrescine-binding periplasmic protein n=1 Tax=Roseiterribacter gracilis TaxID=2812848 RepID=A0A8S8X793_9PROT|nr:putrescine-binding periplasmic protein [Rhodospirillales bacterium TMPK1]
MRSLLSPKITRRAFTGGLTAAVSLPALVGCGDKKSQIRVYNWDTYIGPTTLEDFTKATGTEVRYDLFADNAELFAKLREGNPGYDVIVPSNDTVERMIRADMLVALDRTKIPNFANLEPAFQDAAFDKGRKYTMPYFWGTVGIGYRKSKVPTPPTSWASIFDNPSMKGRISVLGEPAQLVGIAAKYLGYSINVRDPEQIAAAEKLLIKAKPTFLTIAGDDGQDRLLRGEVDLCMEHSGDILQVMKEDPDLGFALPKEGGLLWQDCLAIPKGAPNVAAAHDFINFILRPDVHAAIAATIRYPLPNAAAKKLMSADYLNDSAIYPPADALAKSETQTYPGEATQRLYDETLTRLRAA